MAKQITILSPLDVKPGAISPDGSVVESARLYAAASEILVEATFTDGGTHVFMWPSGTGWTVDGRVGP